MEVIYVKDRIMVRVWILMERLFTDSIVYLVPFKPQYCFLLEIIFLVVEVQYLVFLNSEV